LLRYVNRYFGFHVDNYCHWSAMVFMSMAYKRDAPLSCRISLKQKAIFVAAARAENMTISGFFKRIVMAHADEVNKRYEELNNSSINETIVPRLSETSRPPMATVGSIDPNRFGFTEKFK
jgi:uncharacterized protein (DUF1778 family)